MATAHVRSDASPGEEHAAEEYLTLFEQLGAVLVGAESGPTEVATPESSSAVAPEAPAPGVTAVPIDVPDIEIPQLAELAKNDAVSAAFSYRGSIRQGGSPPGAGEFGVTRSFGSRLTGITITPRPGAFQVAATLRHTITYQVRSRTGPRRQVDIASETDRDITRTNYPTVASDLTPNMGSQNGRPPRTRFWARDLTLRHERVHANDDRANGPGAMAVVTTWLNSQNAPDVAAVRGMLGAVPGRFAAALLAALSTDAGERHAYGDGAPAYKARADAISAKGAKGDYK